MTTSWLKLSWLACLSLVLITSALTGCVDEDDDEVDKVALKAAAELVANNLRLTVTNDMGEVQTDVMALAAFDSLKSVLNSPNDTNNQTANDHLEAYNTLKGTSVCYLMNATGVTVASSNWNTTSSFVGRNYSFRPYFTQAMGDQAGEYFAVGVTTGVRGYYASYPVKDNATVIGVAIIKQELDYLEAELADQVYAFMVNPEGIIFLSSDDTLTLQSLGPLTTQVADDLVASKQFGNGPFTAFLDKTVADGDEVTHDSQDYLVTIVEMNTQGWDIVILSKI